MTLFQSDILYKVILFQISFSLSTLYLHFRTKILSWCTYCYIYIYIHIGNENKLVIVGKLSWLKELNYHIAHNFFFRMFATSYSCKFTQRKPCLLIKNYSCIKFSTNFQHMCHKHTMQYIYIYIVSTMETVITKSIRPDVKNCPKIHFRTSCIKFIFLHIQKDSKYD